MVLSKRGGPVLTRAASAVVIATFYFVQVAQCQTIDQLLASLVKSGKLENATQTVAGFMGHTLCEGLNSHSLSEHRARHPYVSCPFS